MKTLTVSDFALSFGVDKNTFSNSCRQLILDTNFCYRYIKGKELESLLMRIITRIDEDQQVIGALDRKEVWEKGWQENLDEFNKSNFDEKMLVPKFIRSNNPIRYNQRYIFPEHPEFELNYVRVFRKWYLEHYFAKVENIYEFGCGTGFNLLAAAELFPKKKFFGSDFVQSSINLLNTIGKSKKISLSGALFDMINPNYDYHIQDNSGIFTFGSLEQLASKTDNMLNYLITQKPEICVHTEPALELYDPTNLSDYLAIKFQGKRGYTTGLIPKLKKLESEGKIELLKVKRLYVGSLYMEGYNLIVWKPLKKNGT
jgi:hypothetical protein